MIINSVGLHSFSVKSNINVRAKEEQKPNFFAFTNPFSRGLNADQVSFSGNLPIPFFLKNIGNIPCPCCGVKMVKSVDFQRLNETVLAKSSEIAIKALSSFEENMHPVEKACFKQLKELSQKKPNKNLKELLLMVKNEHLEKLKASELNILDKLDEIGKKLSNESAEALNTITDTARNLLIRDNSDNFKRKTVINAMLGLKSRIPEKEIADDLFKVSQELPTSGTDLSAFIVKYSERGPKEIGQRLVSPSLGSVEHIKPKFNGGKNEDKNYLLECAGCNNTRGNTPLDEWVRLHPEMKENIQKNMDAVIEKINSGRIKGHDWYPAAVAKTIAKESKGTLKIDVSKLKNKSTAKKDSVVLIEKYSKEQISKTKKLSGKNKGSKKPVEKNGRTGEPKNSTNPFEFYIVKKKKA